MSRSRDFARIVALVFFIFIASRLLEIYEFVVAGVSKVIVKPDPFRCVQDRFGSERPALEVELFELVPVALDHDVFVLADPLDFLDRSLKFKQLKIMQCAERDHQIEVSVTKGIAVLRPIAEQIGLDIVAGFRKTMFGYIETGNL